MSAALHEEGFPFVRFTGETTWTLKELPDLREFLAYEAELNRFVPAIPRSSCASTTSSITVARSWWTS